MASTIEVSICIVNWNAREFLERCLRSIEATAAPVSHEVIVVDNASQDGSCEMVRQQFPSARLISNERNLGFATANNQAFEVARGEWVYLLNPDTELKPGSLSALLHYLKEKPGAAVAAPRLLNTDGTLQPSVRRFPNFKTAFSRHTILKKLSLFSGEEASHKMADFGFDRELSVDQPAGAALLIRRAILEEVGRLDPHFFLFYEEVDLCKRIKERGYEIYFYPQAEVIHHEGKSRQKNRKQLFLPTLKSMFYYFSKHRGPAATRAFKWLFKPLFIFSTLYEVAEDGLNYWIYLLKKDAYRAQRKKEKCRLKADFLRRDLVEFLFKT